MENQKPKSTPASVEEPREEGLDETPCSPSYFAGMACQCGAFNENECGCPDVDWTLSEVYKLRKSVEEVRQRLYELPELVLANEKKNPAWSKAELWGIERDIIPSIRALCRSAAYLLPENAKPIHGAKDSD